MRQTGWRLLAKRAIDVTAASAMLTTAAPVMVAAAVGIRATMGRPVLFRQERVGRGDRIFTIYKFRTMRQAAPGEGIEADAARITRLGRLLRQTSLDELPQLLNVLKGDMSLVGPRPLLVRYLPRYSAEQRRRHEVLPGLTGWAQIHGRNAVSWDEKFAHDVWYVDHWSLRRDLQVLAKTAHTVLRRDGVSADGHATAPEFMGPSSEVAA
jgi:lipopolysaccharide/colanic/teichoic acid biosynthesis glycosyltransferase